MTFEELDKLQQFAQRHARGQNRRKFKNLIQSCRELLAENERLKEQRAKRGAQAMRRL